MKHSGNPAVNKIVKRGKQAIALEKLACGATQQEVAECTGVSTPTVKSFQEQHKALIDGLRDQFIRKDLPLASKARHDLLKQYSTRTGRKSMDSEDKRAANQHVVKAHESAGLYPGRQSGVQVQVNTQVNTLQAEQLSEDKVFETLMKLKSPGQVEK